MLGGRLGDRYGRRRMFLAGLAAFTAASLLCALAPDIGSLIAFRLLQGAAGAMLLPQGLGLLRENFSGPELTKVFGIFGPVLGLGGIIGPVLGGFLVEGDFFGLGWRSVFLVNLPVGVAALVVAARCVPRKPADRGVSVDTGGGRAGRGAACALLVLPLNQGQEEGWPLWAWLCMAASALGFALFALQQRRRSAAGRQPLVTPGLLRKPAFAVGLGGIALFFAGLVGTQLVLTLYLQIGQHFTAGEAGLGNLPLAVGTAIGGAVSGAFLADRIGRKVLQIGPLVQLAGAALLWSDLDGLTADSFSSRTSSPGSPSRASVRAWSSPPCSASSSPRSTTRRSAPHPESCPRSSPSAAPSASPSWVPCSSPGSGPATSPAGSTARLIVQACLLTAFLAMTFLLPRQGRPEDEQHGVTADAPEATRHAPV